VKAATSLRAKAFGASGRWSVGLPALLLLLATLWFAGGSVRADAMGQTVTRGAAWLLLIGAIVCGIRPRTKSIGPVLVFLSGAVLLVLLQLVPLPPAIWQMLPGRTVFAEAAIVNGDWRPWAIVPGATVNAASSLIVPIATLLFLADLEEPQRRWLPAILLGLVSAAAFVGLLQFSGARLDNPLIDETVGAVSGTFANRNHFALFLAFGCLLAPVWAVGSGRRFGQRGPVAIGLVLFFILTILASGSKAGMLVGALGLALGMALCWKPVRQELRQAPRWAFPALILAIAVVIAAFVITSVFADRAVAIDRAFAMDPGQDMRGRGLPTVLEMVGTYFPAGAGFGSFDPIFRMHEPFELLKRTYFNHAHNDFLEIVLDGGLPALVLLLAALGWWALASWRVWRAEDDPRYRLARLGSAMLLLVFVASAFDYPARTPMVMAMIVIAAVWLSRGAIRAPADGLHKTEAVPVGLPRQNQHL
jgi:O-antigen ligase